MKRLLAFLTGRNSVALVVVLLLVMDAVLVISWFFPVVGAFLERSSLFPILVITSLVEVLLLLSALTLQARPTVLTTDEAAKQRVRELIAEDRSICRVQVLSAGLRSRADFLRALLEEGPHLQVEVVACFGEANPCDLDRNKYGPIHFGVLTNNLSESESRRLRIYQSHNTPSIRQILLSTASGPRYGILGWYTYEQRNRKIQGRRNVQLFVDSTAQPGQEVLNFAERIFERYASAEEADLIWPPAPTPS